MGCTNITTSPEAEKSQISDSTATEDYLRESDTPKETTQDSTAIEFVDKPILSKDEIGSIIRSKLQYKLPSGFSIDNFSRDQFNVFYNGENKWGFEASGSRETREVLPPEIEEQTETEWMIHHRDKITEHQLNVIGVFYEKSYTLDIREMGPIVESTREEITKAEKIHPIIEWSINWPQYVGSYYIRGGHIKNIGIIPLYDIRVEYTICTDNVIFKESFPIAKSFRNGRPFDTRLAPNDSGYYEIKVPIDIWRQLDKLDFEDWETETKFYTSSGYEIFNWWPGSGWVLP